MLIKRKFHFETRSIAIAAFLLSLMTFFSSTIYNAFSESNSILGCVNKKTGILRISSKCTSAEKLISWNSTGPQGIQGEKGDQGEKGVQGDKGDVGPQGLQGLKGDVGLQGVQGPKGDVGPQGIQGPKGDSGSTPSLRTRQVSFVIWETWLPSNPMPNWYQDDRIPVTSLVSTAQCPGGTLYYLGVADYGHLVPAGYSRTAFNCVINVYAP